MDRFRNKQSSEAYFIEWDFADLCGSATIASATVTAKLVSTGADATATITTAGSQSISGTSIHTWVKAGTSGTDYQLTCVATASDGSIYELEGLMLVADIPPAAVTGTGPGRVVAPVIEPVSLAEIKKHLKIDTDIDDDDEMLTGIIAAARGHVENITRRALLSQTWEYCIQKWPESNFIKLPYGNLQSVTSVKWKATDGTETTLTETTDYIVEKNGEGCGRIVLPYGGTWPSDTLYPSNPITIKYVCGWTTAAAIPYEIKAAFKLICTDLYVNREGKTLSNQSYQENEAVQALLASYRLWEEL
ncbi:MAG: head-tail connector protein [Smithella sp.]